MATWQERRAAVLAAIESVALVGTAEEVERGEALRRRALHGTAITRDGSLWDVLASLALDDPEEFEAYCAWLESTSTPKAKRANAAWWLANAKTARDGTNALEAGHRAAKRQAFGKALVAAGAPQEKVDALLKRWHPADAGRLVRRYPAARGASRGLGLGHFLT